MIDSGWIGLIAGLFVGAAIGGIIVYLIVSREAKEAKTAVKSFAYDSAGRLIQVMSQEGV
jgi:acyl-CoA thioesterase